MATDIPFVQEFNFKYEKVERLSPMVRRIVANNPNFFTFFGTNTYIIGNGEVAVIDPGPDSEEHIDAILDGLSGETITHIFITHTHVDHWPGYKPLQAACGAKTYGYQYPEGSRRNSKPDPEEARIFSNQERFEMNGFIPDIGVSHGDVISGVGWSVECVFTPGHASNHMCYQLREENTLFSGDHVMGWSTSVISPPSGDMEKYMDSLNLMLERDDTRYWPAHGPGILDTKNYIQSFIAHRMDREQEILNELKKGIHTIPEMVANIYRDVPEILHPAARRSTLAAIVYMVKRGVVACEGEADADAKFFPG